MCTSPLIRYRLKRKEVSESFGALATHFQIKSLKEIQSKFKNYSAFKQYFDYYMDYQYIPCRKCDECKAKYAEEWGIRAFHEYQMREEGSFITLTVDSTKAKLFLEEKNLKKYCKRCEKGNRYIKYPIDYTLCKGMILDEIKRLRDNILKTYGKKIRYFGCGEYGSPENSERPHYHIIIYGFNFPDKKQVDTSKKGVPIFVSEFLNKNWKYGIATVQDVNARACFYTAKYCMKKLKFSNDQNEYEKYYGREPEFLIMSKGNCNVKRCKHIEEIIKNCKDAKNLRNLEIPYCKNCDKTRGGIGFDYWKKYHKDIMKIGYITIDGIKYQIPKYYLSILKLTNETKYDMYKIKQINEIDEREKKHPNERSYEQLQIKKKINKAKQKFYSRE